MIPFFQSYFQSSVIIRISNREFMILNLGQSFLAQVRNLPPGALVQTEKMPFLPNSGKQETTIKLPGIQEVPVVLPTWNKNWIQVNCRIEKFPPDVPINIPQKPVLVCLEVSWSDTMGGDRISKFGTLLFARK